MPSDPTTIVAQDGFDVFNTWAGRSVDFMQNGYLWWAATDYSGTSGQPKDIRFFRSADGGATWAESIASKLVDESDWSFDVVMFIDKDDYAHILYHPDGNNWFSYRRGTPSADRLSYTWSNPYSMTAYGFGDDVLGCDIVAHREGTGWKAHITFNQVNGSGQIVKLYWRLNISSGGTITLDTQVDVHTFGGTPNIAGAMDFRHEEGDPKAVQSSTPSLYLAYYDISGTQDVNLRFRKFTYSAGGWSMGGLRTIDATPQQGARTLGVVYDGTRVMICSARANDTTTSRVFERDEADTTTTARTPTALSDGTVLAQSIGVGRNGDVWLAALGNTSDDYKKIRFNRSGLTWDAAWTTIEATALSNSMLTMLRGMGPRGLSVVYSRDDQTPDEIHFAHLFENMQAEAALQGVGTVVADGSHSLGGAADLQGVTTFTADGSLRANGATSLQGIARLSAIAEGTPLLDFTRYDAYIETGGAVYGLIFFNEQKPQTIARSLEPTRQNVGNNPDEIRPDFGNFFAQSDFSHGMGQMYFHQPGRDPKRVFYLEGFDITDPGRLSHLHALAEARDTTTIGAIAQVADKVFVINGNRVDRADSFPSGWIQEDPSGTEADQTVEDIAAEGARLFAAIGTGGVHVRSSAGTWTHYQPDGATDLDITPATRVAWLKERLMVVGNTDSRSIYEVTNDSTILAAPLETLPEGWSFQSIFEAGGFIHACAVNPSAGMSRVHHYGVNTAGSALEKKSSTKFPQGQLIYCGEGFPGLVFVAGGVRNSSGGYDPILYRATMSAQGELDYAEVRQEEGAGTSDLSTRAIESVGESILVGWSTGAGTFGGARDGIAVYHVARDAFAYHLKRAGAGGGQRVVGIMPFNGQVLVSIGGDGLYYEDLTAFVTTATLVTSLADWNNAGQKVWDTIEVSHAPLGTATSVKVEYGTEAQEDATWTEVFTSSVVDSVGKVGQISNVSSRVFALRITSTATATIDQKFLGYSVRSLPAPDRNEFQLTRYLRLIASDQKDEDAQRVLQNPRTLLTVLQDTLFSFVKFYESGASWTAWLEDVSTFEPEQPMYETTGGEALKDVFYVQLKMTGAR